MNRKFVGLVAVGGIAVALGLAASSDDANAGHRFHGWHSCGGYVGCGWAACGHRSHRHGFEYDDDDACGWFGYDDDDACGWTSCGHRGAWCGGYGYASYRYSSCGYSSCGHASYRYSGCGYSSCGHSYPSCAGYGAYRYSGYRSCGSCAGYHSHYRGW